MTRDTGPIDKVALQAKYAEERAKRVRADGNAQYARVSDRLPHVEDPYLPVVEREPLVDHVTFAFVGGGFAGLLTGARVAELGITDVRIVEKGGDFGGTWYWNRYPGAQCDTASFVYMPLLEETGHMPSEKYAHGPEIREHCQRIARRYGLYEHALFHTKVTALEWDDSRSRWRIRTNRGDDFTAQYVGIGVGLLHVPKLPGIPGIETFRGHSFHTSRWDYAYTGGDPSGAPMEKLRDQRVAVIGTGATAVQCVPELARTAQRLYVVQRTPSSVDVRGNAPTDPAWFAEIAQPGWQRKWLENFAANQAGLVEEDLVKDGWTDIARRVRARIMAKLTSGNFTPETIVEAFEDCDFEKMEEIRARVDAIVVDGETAQQLKAWYRQLCKRPCFHDEYLQSFNLPNTKLVHTDGKGVERITETGFVAGGVEYTVDCIVYATGFEVGNAVHHGHRAGFDPLGRGGVSLSERWTAGMRTLHGVHVHGFPNLFLVQPAQGAFLISNVPHNLVEASATIAATIEHARTHGHTVIEATKAAEDGWVDLLHAGLGVMGRMLDNPDCTPGYYNNEGQGGDLYLAYPAGASAFFQYIDGWRKSGHFTGLEFR